MSGTGPDLRHLEGRLRFRPLGRADLAMFSEWLARPHVQRWWQEDPSPAAVERKYGPGIDGGDPTDLVVVELDSVPAAFVQRYRLADNPGWQEALEPAGTPAGAAGMDYLIADEDRIGQGLGPEILRRFVASTWDRYPEVPAIVVDVSVANRRSWRALEKVGFTRTWTGHIKSDEPGDCDEGPQHVHVLPRPSRSDEAAAAVPGKRSGSGR